MKQIILLVAAALFCKATLAQKDTLPKVNKADTIRIGGLIIIDNRKNRKTKDTEILNDSSVTPATNTVKKKNPNVSTNWLIFDLGFTNYTDNTNYATAGGYAFSRPGFPALSAGDFKLSTAKSINVNVWFFMQKLNLISHHVNLKYGLGLELNNYRYKTNASLSYKEGGTVPYTNNAVTANQAFVYRDSISFTKNKLVTKYITVPLMFNFISNPDHPKKGISLSAGVSAGYLLGQYNKQVSGERGKQKNRGDYDLQKFKLSYIGELGLGPIRLYGSYTPTSIYERALDMKPYTVGIRFSNW
jgi:hypothetical protein